MKRLVIFTLALLSLTACLRYDIDEVLLARTDVSLTLKGKLQYAIGGRYYGIRDGVYVQAGTLNAYDARTAVGHNANGDIVMMVIPGDDADATEAGATVVDVAQVFMDLDIDVNYMLNLDGGGSTNLIVENTGGSPVLTTPLYSGTSQRAIADIMAIVAD